MRAKTAAFPIRRACAAVVIASLSALAAPAFAQTAADTLQIGENAFVGSQGNVGVNAAAGSLNQQANTGVVANGSELSISLGAVRQHLGENTVSSSAHPQSATIADDAFAGSNGVIAVNGAAGAENQQANVFAIAIGIEGRTLAADVLSQTRASTEPPETTDSPADLKTADIGPQAFSQASGLVQVNLTAGERNSSANLFALTLAESAN
jgi:hypothetical protein